MKTKKNSKINPVANGLLLYFICVDIIHFYHLYSVLTLVALLSFVICCHQWFSVTLFSFVICWHQWLCCHWWSMLISFTLSFVICVEIFCFVVICDLCCHQWLCCHLWSVAISDFVVICDLLPSVILLSLVIYVDIIHFIICDLCWHLLLCCHLWSVLASVTLLSFVICVDIIHFNNLWPVLT
jgi:hypothetical protein